MSGWKENRMEQVETNGQISHNQVEMWRKKVTAQAEELKHMNCKSAAVCVDASEKCYFIHLNFVSCTLWLNSQVGHLKTIENIEI